MLCSVPFSRVGSWSYQRWPWNEKAFAVCVQPACRSSQSTLYPWNFNINSQNSCVWNQMHFKNPSFLVSLCIYIEFREAHGRLQRSSNLWNIVGKNQFRSWRNSHRSTWWIWMILVDVTLPSFYPSTGKEITPNKGKAHGWNTTNAITKCYGKPT